MLAITWPFIVPDQTFTYTTSTKSSSTIYIYLHSYPPCTFYLHPTEAHPTAPHIASILSLSDDYVSPILTHIISHDSVVGNYPLLNQPLRLLLLPTIVIVISTAILRAEGVAVDRAVLRRRMSLLRRNK